MMSQRDQENQQCMLYQIRSLVLTMKPDFQLLLAAYAVFSYEWQYWFAGRVFSYIQDEAFYIGRILKELCCYSFFLALTLKFLTTYGNINSVYHSDKI